jgi:hypothetical protein
MRRSSKPLGLTLESLEDRRMMTGDVKANAIGKILYITGDNAANGVMLTSSGDLIDVVGIDQGGAATTINKDDTHQTFFKIKDVVISLGKGDDAVVVTNLNLKGTVFVSGGLGNDAVGLGNFTDTGLFADSVDAALGALTCNNSLIVDASDGDDTVLAQAVTTNKALTIAMGAGNDSLSMQNISVGKSLSIDLGVGNDTANLTPSNPADPGITVVKNVGISTGAGDDILTINKLSAKKLGISLGGNDDTLDVENTTTINSTAFNGDTGINTYNDNGGNTLAKLTTKNFQTPV